MVAQPIQGRCIGKKQLCRGSAHPNIRDSLYLFNIPVWQRILKMSKNQEDSTIISNPLKRI